MNDSVVVSGKSQLELLGDDLLKKGSGVIQIRVVNGEKRTLLARKITNALFKIAQKAGVDQKAYSTSRLTLKELTKFNSNDVDRLKQTANELTNLKVELDITNASGVRTVGTTQLFASILFQSSGQVLFEIPQIAKMMLADSAKYALINMQVQGDIESVSAYILYEQCLLYIEEGRTPSFSMDEWREIFECPINGSYKQFKFFNLHVIKPAIEEINRITDILIEVVYLKEGRSYSAMYFNIQKKPQYLLSSKLQDEKLLAEEALIECGVSETTAFKLVREFDFERIMGNIEYTKMQFEAGKVKSVSGYVVEAIKNNYKPKPPKLVIQHQEKMQQQESEKKAAEIKAKQEAENRNLLSQKKNQSAQDYLDNLSEEEKQNLYMRFGDALAINNPVLHKTFKRSGVEPITVSKALLQYIGKEFLG